MWKIAKLAKQIISINLQWHSSRSEYEKKTLNKLTALRSDVTS